LISSVPLAQNIYRKIIIKIIFCAVGTKSLIGSTNILSLTGHNKLIGSVPLAQNIYRTIINNFVSRAVGTKSLIAFTKSIFFVKKL